MPLRSTKTRKLQIHRSSIHFPGESDVGKEKLFDSRNTGVHRRVFAPVANGFAAAKIPVAFRAGYAYFIPMNLEEIYAEAQHLPRVKQGELIGRLLEGFAMPHYDVSDSEVARRIEETDSGVVADISHDELLSGIKHIRKD